MKAKILLIVAFLFLISPSYSSKIIFEKSGEIIVDKGKVSSLSLFLTLPQETNLKIEKLEVFPKNYEILKKGENKIIKIYFSNLKPGKYSYRILAHIKTKETLFYNEPKNLSYNYNYLKFGELTKPTSKIVKISYENFKGKTLMQKIYSLSEFVNSFLNYDTNYKNITLPAREILKIRKGVCDEYSIFLASLLKIQKVPTRIVYGYAFSNSFWEPHAWIEVNLENNWYPIDILFNQFFYLDDLHIPLYYAQEKNFADKIEVEGYNVEYRWITHTPKINIVSLSQTKKPSIYLNLPEEIDSWTIINASFLPQYCNKYTFEFIPCINKKGSYALFFFPNNFSFPTCKKKEFLFLIRPKLKKNYVCPSSIYINGKLILKKNFTVYGERFKDTKLNTNWERTSDFLILPEKVWVTTDYLFFGYTSKIPLIKDNENHTIYLYKNGKVSKLFLYSQLNKSNLFIKNVSFFIKNNSLKIKLCVNSSLFPVEYNLVYCGKEIKGKFLQVCNQISLPVCNKTEELFILVKKENSVDAVIQLIPIIKKKSLIEKILEILQELFSKISFYLNNYF